MDEGDDIHWHIHEDDRLHLEREIGVWRLEHQVALRGAPLDPVPFVAAFQVVTGDYVLICFGTNRYSVAIIISVDLDPEVADREVVIQEMVRNRENAWTAALKANYYVFEIKAGGTEHTFSLSQIVVVLTPTPTAEA